MTAPIGGGSAAVGSAYVIIRAVTDKVRQDIVSGIRGAWKDADKSAEGDGKATGTRYARGAKQGVQNERIGDALRDAWKASEREAGASGKRAGSEYAKNYSAQAARARAQNRDSRGRFTGGGGSGGGGGGRGGSTIAQLASFKMDRGGSIVLNAMNSALSAMVPLAMAAMGALAAQGAIAGLTGLLGVLTQVTGVLAVLPAMAAAVAAPIAAIAIGGHGVGEAFKAMAQQSQGAEQRAKAVASAQEGVVSAQDALAAAHDRVADAQDNVLVAERTAASAARAHQAAREAVTEAIKDQTERIQDLNLQLKGAAYDEEAAAIGVERAKERLAKMPAGSDALDYREALNDLKQAEHQLDVVREGNEDLRQETDTANKEGVEGSKAVKDARQSEIDAAQNAADAQKGIAKAQEGVADAQKNVAKAQRDLAKAIQEVQDAANSGGVDKFAEAMAKLSPAAQSFVLAMRGLGPIWADTRKFIQENLFQGLGEAVSSLAYRYLPELRTGLGKVATSLNGVAKGIIAAFDNPARAFQFQAILARVAGLIDKMSPGFTSLANAFMNLSLVGSEFFGQFGGGFTTGAKKIETWTQNFDRVRTVIGNALNILSILWDVLKNIGGTIGGIFRAAMGPLTEVGNAAQQFFANLNNWVNSATGQNALGIFFTNGANAIQLLLPAVEQILQGLVEVGGMLAGMGAQMAPGFLDFVTGLREGLGNLQPLADRLGPALSDLFSALGSILPKLGDTLSVVGEQFVPWIEHLSAFVERWGPGFLQLIQNVSPALPFLAAGLIAVAGAWKGFTLVESASGVIGRMKDLIGRQTQEQDKKKKSIFGLTAATKVWHGVEAAAGATVRGTKTAIAASGNAIKSGALTIGRWVQGIKFAAIAQKAWNIVMIATNVIMRANPLILIATLLIGLGAALVVAYKKSETFRDIVNGAWEAVKTAVGAVWNFIKPTIEAFGNAIGWVVGFIRDHWKLLLPIMLGPIGIIGALIIKFWDQISGAFTWAWETVIKPTIQFISDGFLNMGRVFAWGWDNIIKPGWDLITAGISFVWNNILKPLWEGIKLYFQGWAAIFRWAWENLIKPAWDALGAGIAWVWDNVIKPAWDNLQVALHVLGEVFRIIWETVIKPAWEALGNGISWVVDNVITPAWEALKSGLEGVKNFFSTMVEGIRGIWDGLKGILAKPVNFVINTVYEGGLRKAWNAIAPKIGLPELGEIKPIPEHRAGGYIRGPGGPTDDKIPAMLSNGEYVLRASAVRRIGVDRLNQVNSGQVPHYAGGGPVRGDAPPWSGGGGESHLKPAAILARRNVHLYWPEIATIGGYRASDPYPDHPSGLALDIMTGDPIGTQVNNWLHDQMNALALNYTIWKQFYKPAGGAGNLMEDRGSPTQNHMDHVHALFNNNGVPGIGEGGVGGGGGGNLWDKATDFLRNLAGELFEIPVKAMVNAVPDPLFGMAGDVGHFAKKSAQTLADKAIAFVKGKAEEADHIKGVGTLVDAGGAVQAATGPVVDQVRNTLALVGWNEGADWDATNWIINHESGWRPTVRNSIGAYGLYQFLGHENDKYGALGAYSENPAQQTGAWIAYIKDRYGTPSQAKQFWEQNGWYDQGGWLKPGVTTAVNMTGKPEAILTHDQWDWIRQLIKAVADASMPRMVSTPLPQPEVSTATTDTEKKPWDWMKQGPDWQGGNAWLASQGYERQFQQLGVDALKETVIGGLLGETGLDAPLNKAIDSAFGATAATSTGTPAADGAPSDGKVAEVMVFNGMTPEKVIAEVERAVKQLMVPVTNGRYRGGAG